MRSSPIFDASPPVAYCTMFDSGYLSRGLALIDSMRSVGMADPVWVLCLDDAVKAYLEALGLPEVHTLSLRDVEATTSGLEEARRTRSRVEYFFTCTPALVRTVLDRATDREWVIYLDADMCFYDSPERIFTETVGGDVAIVPHRFPDHLRSLEQYGVHNVAWVMFRSTDAGRACADWWSASCIEWCYDHPEDGRYADQGYLDQFPSRFPTTVVIDDAGVNLAPWNLGRHQLSLDEEDRVVVDGSSLIFFHFHGLRKKGDWIYPNLATYRAELSPVARDRLYRPYIASLDAIERGATTINFGRPLPAGAPQVTSRNQRSLRSAAYRARRRVMQFRERRSGGAFRVSDFDDDDFTSRRYG